MRLGSEVPLTGVSIAGEPVELPEDESVETWTLDLFGPPAGDVTLLVQLAEPAALAVDTVRTVYGLGDLAEPRPSSFTPGFWGTTDVRMILDGNRFPGEAPKTEPPATGGE